jgi:hypothetical protein
MVVIEMAMSVVKHQKRSIAGGRHFPCGDSICFLWPPMIRTLFLAFAAASLLHAQSASAPAQKPNHDLGFDDTPMLPGQPYHVHDYKRPHPQVVTPSPRPGGPPSDAIVLFDGKDLSKWTAESGKITHTGHAGAPEWKVENGYFEIVPHTSDLATKESFGDCQLHVEWQVPKDITGRSQARGNSGVLLMSRYEVQVLDAYNNPTYADGQAAALYGQWPPLVNPARPDGEWQVYDIIFEAPKFEGTKAVKPAYFTILFNGVLVHNHQASLGPMVYRQVAHYEPHPAEQPLLLQNHNSPVRYRNIWLRRLKGYDLPESK